VLIFRSKKRKCSTPILKRQGKEGYFRNREREKSNERLKVNKMMPNKTMKKNLSGQSVEYVWQDSSYKTMNVILFHARDRYTDFYTSKSYPTFFDYKRIGYGYSTDGFQYKTVEVVKHVKT
jgi:hypothetical protein